MDGQARREPCTGEHQADSIAFVNAGRKEEQSANPKQASKKGAKAKNTPEPPKDAPEAKADDLPF